MRPEGLVPGVAWLKEAPEEQGRPEATSQASPVTGLQLQASLSQVSEVMRGGQS